VLKVGIFSPYAKNETTLAATQIADWLIRFGADVEFLSENPVVQGVHRFWDKKVKRGTNSAVYKWAATCTHLFWFSANSNVLHLASLTTKQSKHQMTQHVFFPKWHNWNKESETFCLLSNRTICLNRDTADWLDKRLDRESTNRTWANLVAPSILQPMRYKEKLPHKNKKPRNFLVVLTKSIELDLAPKFFDIFAEMLGEGVDVHFDFLVDKPLRRDTRKQLYQLQKHFPVQITVSKDLPYYDYPRYASACDFVYLPETRYSYGALLSLLISSGTPIICHKVSPTENYIQHESTGFLLPCVTYEKPTPIAEVQLDMVKKTLTYLAEPTGVQPWQLKNNVQEYLERKQAAFYKFISSELLP
jgi:glycosyltransferase involved in cell wall biosynthesis